MISVIVPVYNSEQYLHQCVVSIMNQEYSDLQIILVDDGSSDSCSKICDELAVKDCRINVIHKKNGGLSSARNAGIENAQGDYLAFVDSDDTIDLNTYLVLSHIIEESEADIAICRHQIVSNFTEVQKCDIEQSCTKVLNADQMWQEIFENMNNSSANKLYSRTIIGENRFPNYLHGEDFIFNILIALSCKKGVMTDLPLYHYYKRTDSITTSSFSKRKFKEIESKDKIREIVLSKKMDQISIADKYCFRARMNVAREMIRDKHEKDYETELESIRSYVKNNFKRVKHTLKFKEIIEVYIFLVNISFLYRMMLRLILIFE